MKSRRWVNPARLKAQQSQEQPQQEQKGDRGP